jgi:transcriptional regulator with XRE-family HTH domain
MPLLRELGTAARRRRQDIGLSQQAVAELAGLSRATVNELESGKLKELGSARIESLANSLGFAVGVLGSRPSRDGTAIAEAARLAGVPYRKQLPEDLLEGALREGTVPPRFIPQMRTLLQEAPVAVLAAVADEMEQRFAIPPRQTWEKMRALAAVLKCDRPLWLAKST